MLVAVGYPPESSNTFPRGVKRSRTPDHRENVPAHGGHDDGMRSPCYLFPPNFPDTAIVIVIFSFFFSFFFSSFYAYALLIIRLLLLLFSLELGAGLVLVLMFSTERA